MPERAFSIVKHEEARQICESCPARMQCLNNAMRSGVEGIWGGTVLTERKWMRRLTGIIPTEFYLSDLLVGLKQQAESHVDDQVQEL